VWAFHDRLNDFRKNHDENEKEILGNKFDMLRSTETGYAKRDKRIVLPKEKELLLLLKSPEIPIHNNPAKLA